MSEPMDEGASSKSVKKFGKFSSLEEFTKVILKFPCFHKIVNKKYEFVGWHATDNGSD